MTERTSGESEARDLQDGPDLIGGRLSLDFVNTEGEVRNGPPEWIGSYEDLIRWSVRAGGVGERVARRLRSRAAKDSREARDVWERAVELREALYRLIVATIDGRPASAEDRAVFTAEVSAALAHLRPQPGDPTWQWRFEDGDQLDRVVWPIARDAADLLTSEELGRVKECSGRDCTWLFLDQSRNRSRRWCDMAVCGNRAKARRHYERTQDDG